MRIAREQRVEVDRAGRMVAPDEDVVWERRYASLVCGNCCRGPVFSPEVRFYRCGRCGQPTYECLTCTRIAHERWFTPFQLCARCNVMEDVLSADVAGSGDAGRWQV